MQRVLILALCVLLLPGCLASAGVRVGNTGPSATQPSVGPGGTFYSSGVSLRVSDGPVLGGIVGVGVLGALFGWGEQRRAPELDASRPVREQNCSKPFETSGANLRCK